MWTSKTETPKWRSTQELLDFIDYIQLTVWSKKKKKKTPQVVANKRWGLSLGLQMLGVHLLYEPSAIKRGKSAAESNGK